MAARMLTRKFNIEEINRSLNVLDRPSFGGALKTGSRRPAGSGEPELDRPRAHFPTRSSPRQRMEVSNVHRLNVLGQFDEIF